MRARYPELLHAYRHIGNAIFLTITADEEGCFTPGKDISIPPMIMRERVALRGGRDIDPASRDRIAYFKGIIPEDGHWAYSRGVRQHMYREFANRTGWSIEGAWGGRGDTGITTSDALQTNFAM